MSNKQIIILAFVAIAVMGIIGVTVSQTRNQQDTRTRAQSTGGSCSVPEQVQNVQIEYPNCQ